MNFSNMLWIFLQVFEHTQCFWFDYLVVSVVPMFEFANDAAKLLTTPQNIRGEKTFITIPSW